MKVLNGHSAVMQGLYRREQGPKLEGKASSLLFNPSSNPYLDQKLRVVAHTRTEISALCSVAEHKSSTEVLLFVCAQYKNSLAEVKNTLHVFMPVSYF